MFCLLMHPIVFCKPVRRVKLLFGVKHKQPLLKENTNSVSLQKKKEEVEFSAFKGAHCL